MWENLNVCILIVEAIIVLFGLLFVVRKNNSVKTTIFMCMVFALNFVLYVVPWLHSSLEEGAEINVVLYLLSSISSTIKQFVGEVKADAVEAYTKLYPLYTWTFFIGAVLAVVTTSGAAISVFGKKIKNSWRVTRMLNGECCDIVVGSSADALVYAKHNKNTVLLLDDRAEQARVKSLIGDGYAVLQKSITPALFLGRHFNASTRYHVLCLDENNSISEMMQVILAYLDMQKMQKKIRFFVEMNDVVAEIVQKQIAEREALEKNKPAGARRTYREHITVFTRNELIARKFVNENPITAHMPQSLFCEDTSVKPETKLNVFMIGFSSLSREIYKQFVINNQLATVRDGEYRVLPLNYYIYAANADSREWNMDGLKVTLEKLAERGELYFPLPELPYHTECFRESMFGVESLRAIADLVKTGDLSYLIIDTGDVYRNVSIANSFKLLMDDGDKCRIFVYTDAQKVPADAQMACYGDLTSVFTHEIVVNESLVELAKAINGHYFKAYNDPKGEVYKTEEALAAAIEEDWRHSTYFNMYSNIYLANNLRLKLQLLGLDYAADGKAAGQMLFPEFSKEDRTYARCLQLCKRSALLAQEHFRWNAYHLLSGYLPKKKEKVKVLKKGETGLRVDHKEAAAKKHACLTTYMGLAKLSEHLAAGANALYPDRGYTAEQFEYYDNDGLLFEILPEFFAKKGYSLYRR